MTANGAPNVERTVNDHRGERRPERRVYLSEAAELLGVSKDAVRMRVKRGTLRSEKGENGRVYVWVNVTPDDGPNDTNLQGEVEHYRELIDELRDRVRSLEEANSENRRIIAALTQRIPELPAASETAPPDAPGSPERGAQEQDGAPPRPATDGTQAGSEPLRVTGEAPIRGSPARPWWRRVLGA
jgi:hypothetical protein